MHIPGLSKSILETFPVSFFRARLAAICCICKKGTQRDQNFYAGYSCNQPGGACVRGTDVTLTSSMKIIKKILKWTGLLLLACLLVFTVFVLLPVEKKVAPIQPRENTEYWEMNGGFRIAYTQHHNTADTLKTPVVFLHGGPGGYIHSSIIRALKPLSHSGHDVYLYDQRGSGLSDRLPRITDVNFDHHLADLQEIVTEHIGTDKVILIGQSFGASIAAHYAAYYPDKVEKVILTSPGDLVPQFDSLGQYIDIMSRYPTPDTLEFKEVYSFVSDVNSTAIHPKAIVAGAGALLFDRKFIADSEMDALLNNLASRFTRGMVCDSSHVLPEEGGGGLYAYIGTNNDDMADVRHLLPQVKAPLLVMHGQCDFIPFAAAYEYVDLMPNGTYTFIPDAGHEIWWDREEVFTQTIIDFLQ